MSAQAQPLVVDRVARRYGPRWALAGVSFSLPPGAGLMLTGPNGSGKSTLLRCISTAIRVHHGSIRWGVADLWEERARLRPQLAMLGHQHGVWDDLSARENLHAWLGFGGTADVDATLRRVGLNPTRPEPVRAYSAGMRRRLSLARLLLKQPALVLLDEPFTALDPAGRELLSGVIRELRSGGASVLLATHLPTVASPLVDHAIHLIDGKLVYEGDPAGSPAQDGQE